MGEDQGEGEFSFPPLVTGDCYERIDVMSLRTRFLPLNSILLDSFQSNYYFIAAYINEFLYIQVEFDKKSQDSAS